MQFIVVAYDDTDEGALQRRLAVREAHLKSARAMLDKGELVYGAGILTDDGRMIGSMMICEFPSRDEIGRWLQAEPYVTGKVWKNITIHRAQVAPFCASRQ